MATLEERIAGLALRTFNSLPAKSKPQSRTDGVYEWVPMTAVVLARDINSADELLDCVSIATGCKCLPESALSKCHGEVLHDGHAEILALRGLNRWLLVEVASLLERGEGHEDAFLTINSPTAVQKIPLISRSWAPFRLRPNVSIHLFSTEPPCGDASMESLISELGPEASKPWTEPQSLPLQTMNLYDNLQPQQVPLVGRAFFSSLGRIRRKPSRADAEPTLSKSCTDKLALKQLTSLLSFPAYYFIANTHNAYLSSLILPHDRYSMEACNRAFGSNGRLASVKNLTIPEPYSYKPFKILTLPLGFPSFAFSKPVHKESQNKTSKTTINRVSKPTNVSVLYINNHSHHQQTYQTPPVIETLLNGVKKGYPAFSKQQQPPPSPSISSSQPAKKASIISRSSMFRLGKDIARHLSSLNEELLPIQKRPGNPPGLDLRREGNTNDEEEDDEKRDMEMQNTKHSSLQAFIGASTYDEAKWVAGADDRAGARAKTKSLVTAILPGHWPKNVGDGDWSVD